MCQNQHIRAAIQLKHPNTQTPKHSNTQTLKHSRTHALNMCTVTYLPIQGGFTLTHNRDEAPSRSLFSIERQRTNRRDTLLFPRDAKAGGTWIVATQSGKTACLLNGAFLKHHRQPPYRRSRGLMLLDFLDLEQPDSFFEQYPLEGIEPFTLLFFQQGNVVEFRWDGAERFHKNSAWEFGTFLVLRHLVSPGNAGATRESFSRLAGVQIARESARSAVFN